MRHLPRARRSLREGEGDGRWSRASRATPRASLAAPVAPAVEESAVSRPARGRRASRDGHRILRSTSEGERLVPSALDRLSLVVVHGVDSTPERRTAASTRWARGSSLVLSDPQPLAIYSAPRRSCPDVPEVASTTTKRRATAGSPEPRPIERRAEVVDPRRRRASIGTAFPAGEYKLGLRAPARYVQYSQCRSCVAASSSSSSSPAAYSRTVSNMNNRLA